MSVELLATVKSDVILDGGAFGFELFHLILRIWFDSNLSFILFEFFAFSELLFLFLKFFLFLSFFSWEFHAFVVPLFPCTSNYKNENFENNLKDNVDEQHQNKCVSKNGVKLWGEISELAVEPQNSWQDIEKPSLW